MADSVPSEHEAVQLIHTMLGGRLVDPIKIWIPMAHVVPDLTTQIYRILMDSRGPWPVALVLFNGGGQTVTMRLPMTCSHDIREKLAPLLGPEVTR